MTQEAKAQGYWFYLPNQPYGSFSGLDLGNGIAYGYGVGLNLTESPDGVNATITSDFSQFGADNYSTTSPAPVNAVAAPFYQTTQTSAVKPVPKIKKPSQIKKASQVAALPVGKAAVTKSSAGKSK